jgi:hypothetical protein
MVGGTVTNANVSCSDNPTTLSASLSTLALATNGNQRIITITNTGGSTADNVTYSTMNLPSGTTISPAPTGCGNIHASGTCVLNITPGPMASNDPATLTISGSNTNTLTNNLYVLTYGSIYEEGYIFGIDDTTASNESIGGQEAALSDFDNGSLLEWSTNATPTSALSLTDDAANTSTLINTLGVNAPAAAACNSYSIDSSGNSPCTTGTCYNNWYLPAICQMASVDVYPDCVSETPNMLTNLSALVSGYLKLSYT